MPSLKHRQPLISRLILLALLLLAVPLARADGFSAELDRNRIGANETLTLHLSAEGQSADDPDLSPLSKDFEVLGQSSGSRVNIVNGAMSQTREWTLELAPRRTGTLEVPPLTQGGRQSKALKVEVVPADQANAGQAPKPIFVDTQIEAAKPYVQQPFIYRVRVLFREQPRRAVLGDPAVEGATLERQGDDKNYTEEVDGQRYSVVERRYRVVAQRSGALTIGGPRLEALMPDARAARRSPFADFGDFGPGFPNLLDQTAGRRVIERGPDRTIQIRPQPDIGAAAWLPAESVQLSDEWTPTPPRWRVGEPVTRTLAITARGTSAAQLPTLDPGTPAGAKVYPEPPKLEDVPGPTLTALKTLKLALVPTRAGALTLPEIRLDWWDTTTDQARVAVIPARTVQVAPGDNAVAEPPRPATTAPTAAPVPEPAAPQGDAAATETKTAAGSGLIAGLQAHAPWSWLALFFALAWLLTLAWAVRRQTGARASSPKAAARQVESIRAARTQARQACSAGDLRAARTALLAWGQARWPQHPPGGLGELGERLGPAAGGLLEAIDRAIYAPAGQDWDGTAAWQVLEPALLAQERTDASAGTDPLPNLYPGS
ncbi:BatD family protein [uncultured Thiodictyon sp.]|uniref:BatD family protein n=1 Tax=uncultured Thiodictyon sp. TaxID=1846217 RepID=UPI0025DAD422|nr:BatD family protein [uncultured Thiodictyon sp.]